jgi:photosystem II protein
LYRYALGDVLTRGEGPLEQLRAEETYVLNHINPVEILKDTLEVAGFYVEVGGLNTS